ncbi:MAG: Gfo/Idh/MocA family protein [Pirellulales bacterium]|jgi:predicted dehydrogenase
MTKGSNRREFVKSTAALGAGAWVAGGISIKPSISALEEIRFGCIGVGGKGASDSTDAGNHGKVVAMCDIDDNTLNKKKQEFKDAATYNDFRKMFDEMGDKIDAVTVSTPDHSHAVAALQALRANKAVYCQKPLTHSIEEARMLGDAAKKSGVVTQMGNQGTALSNLRESAALIRNGVVGDVKEVHVWTNRPVWPQSFGLKVKEGTPPNTVHWKEWIGPAKTRPYSAEIHPFKWRGFWDFGTGALGDMACHTLNMSYMALDLKFPTSVEAVSEKHDGNCYPASSKIVFEFPALDGRPALKMIWYDGGEKPSDELMADLPKQQRGKKERHFTSAALIVGDKGKFYSPGDYGGEPRATGLIVDGEFTRQRSITNPTDGATPYEKFKNIEYVKSPGHFTEFAQAIKGEGKTVSEFVEYSGPLTETILLGNLAVWSGKRIDWDAKTMVAANADEATQKMVRHDYENGYTIH